MCVSGGKISAIIDIDYEQVQEKSCQLTVIANDEKVNSDPGVYTISVTDKDEAPVLSKSDYRITTPEVNVSSSDQIGPCVTYKMHFT